MVGCAVVRGLRAHLLRELASEDADRLDDELLSLGLRQSRDEKKSIG